MEQHLLKTQLRDAIGSKKVSAAAFFTFNFDPVFFENYVLPLLTPRPDHFSDSTIANQVLWREVLRLGEMPEVTVYCDFHAKNNAEAPALGYEVRCLRLPEASNTICNFHPKHLFILLEDDSLIVLTGSGNITPAGWCQNVEAFHLQKISKTAWQRPFTQQTNFLQRQFRSLCSLLNLPPSKAEQTINDRSLRYFSDDTLSGAIRAAYFSSLFEPFSAFLDREVFKKAKIERAEIISPFFSNDTDCLDLLHKKGVAQIRFLLPTALNDEILMDKVAFEQHSKKGVSWHRWANGDLNNRHNHAKIYRFYDERNVFSIIGSVNFTVPAWGAFILEKRNRANWETAVLFTEKTSNMQHLLAEREEDTSAMRFVSKSDLENSSGFLEERARRNAPDLKFTLDWKAKELHVQFLEKSRSNLCFKGILNENQLFKNDRIALEAPLLRRLAKNCLIEVLETVDGLKHTHFYYPEQKNFEHRPLPFRLTAASILQCWDKLGDTGLALALSIRLAENTDDDTGELGSGALDRPSLLNEWAQHFNGLVKLERSLFAEKRLMREREEQDKNISWYLLHKSFDTLPTYLDELRDQYEEGKIYGTFYWTVLQIVSQNFYEAAAERLGRSDDGKRFREIGTELTKAATECLKKLGVHETEKWDWLREKLKASI
ncbi:MAG: hypothetical protein KF734_02295 [Saprospiraceae bacterium]|nr:hypothetical protein [Saprospiraceae bacterium]